LCLDLRVCRFWLLWPDCVVEHPGAMRLASWLVRVRSSPHFSGLVGAFAWQGVGAEESAAVGYRSGTSGFLCSCMD
jgi:hypothetical protein